MLRAVVHNGRQLLMTSLLCCVVVYVYSVLGFWTFRDMYVGEGDNGDEPMCSTVYACFMFTLNQVRGDGLMCPLHIDARAGVVVVVSTCFVVCTREWRESTV